MRSCSCKMRSCSSLRRSMMTLRARAILCSFSTLERSSAVFVLVARDAAGASGYIICMPFLSFCAIATRWFLMLSLSS